MTLFPKPITYYQVSGSFSSGIWVSTQTLSEFSGSVQPVTFRDLAALNIGRKDVGKVNVYSSTPLNISREGSTASGDIVIWQSKKWEVIAAANFQNDLIPHYHYIAEYRGEA